MRCLLPLLKEKQPSSNYKPKKQEAARCVTRDTDKNTPQRPMVETSFPREYHTRLWIRKFCQKTLVAACLLDRGFGLRALTREKVDFCGV